MSDTSMRKSEPGPPREGQRRGTVGIAYAFAAYAAFVAVAGYSVAFVADAIVPLTIDRGRETSPVLAITIDALLFALFGLQHTVMARPAFKQWWSRFVPTHLERATYVLATSVALAFVYWQWRPLPSIVWDLQADVLRAIVWALFMLGWVLVVAMTFVFSHAEFLGLKQPIQHRRGELPDEPRLLVPLPFRLVRHPLMTGFLIAFWVTPTMTVGHVVFATLSTVYILIGVTYEERDLLANLPGYADYAARTPRFFPRLTRAAR
jgi:protein-S-isoprenylcysteine O-methyltransferase Ste14